VAGSCCLGNEPILKGSDNNRLMIQCHSSDISSD
jgi:hypothetical protein